MNGIIVVIPAYKPDYCLSELVGKLKIFDVLVVDDGSGWDYAPVFSDIKQMGISVISYNRNKGKGHALKTAFQYINKNYPEKKWIISADADGQHTADDIAKMVKATEKSCADMIIGVRKFTGYVPLRSRIGNRVSALLYYLLTGRKIIDTQSGLRAYRSTRLKKFCKIEGQRYEYEINCLLQIGNIQSIPIETVYQRGNKSSHYRVWKDTWRIWRAMIRTCFCK